ncbi:type IV pilus modification protein PilV [Janthinobacterium fluminis]|uniref:Type IV pilus modification protein PilV n=1 Tax=Janthinobacterium fluminis TaxID=2987524 RepID=A0ABT5K6D5_9BURK|nr:type IV pilus modification protein PilV [Janthinobacterium fluminis]MDC8760565.1 type IV pilus modification protein PilV [Janthinobacterium fluminis]
MHPCKSPGFTLIEVLVAVLVLALGLVGGTALQLTALRTRHQSALLSGAVQLAAGMADKMRANSVQMSRPDADNPYLNLRYDVAADAEPAPPAQLCFAAQPCDSAQLAGADIYELKQQLRKTLPGGRLVICRDTKGLGWDCDSAPGAPIVIKLGWRGKNPDGTPLRLDPLQDTPGVTVALAGGTI